MVTNEYKIAYSEVLEILKHISTDDIKKVPTDMIEMFKSNALRDNYFVYNPNKTLQEQNVSETARTIIAILFRDYWATEIQREKILAKQNYDREKLKQELYDPSNLFKKKSIIIQENEEEQQLVIYKESKLKRIFSKILNFLKFK